MLVSLGLDTLAEDPIGGFAGIQNREDYENIGKEIGGFVKGVGGRTSFCWRGDTWLGNWESALKVFLGDTWRHYRGPSQTNIRRFGRVHC